MGSRQIVEILRAQHTKDIFVDECKDGPTWTKSHARMDAWVMTRSWSHLQFTGYEIKVSHSDFASDNKWPAYLPLCNQLFFVCPKGVIDPSEMPAGVGLKYAIGSRCTTVVKAAHRECVPPMELFCYLLMCRTRVTNSTYYKELTDEDKLKKYKDWLAAKEESKNVGDVIRQEVAWRIQRIKEENDSLKKRLAFIAQAEKVLREMGITMSWYDSDERHTRAQAEKFLSLIPADFIDELKRMEARCQNLAGMLEEKAKEAKLTADLVPA